MDMDSYIGYYPTKKMPGNRIHGEREDHKM